MRDPRDKKYRERAAKKQSGCCIYCGLPMWSDDPVAFARQYGLSLREVPWFKCTAEHLKARRSGGTSALNNIAAACWRCNMLRHHRSSSPTWEQFRNMVQRRMKAGRWHPQHLRVRLGTVLQH